MATPLGDEHKSASDGRVTRVVLMSLSFVGLGIIIGFGSFYLQFSWRCGALMEEIQQAHKSELESSNTLHQEFFNKYNQCISDTRQSLEIEELKGRLEAQATLVNHHEALVLHHETSKQVMTRLREQKEAADEMLESMRVELEGSENQMEDVHKELQQLHHLSEQTIARLKKESKAHLEQALRDQSLEFQKEKDQLSRKISDLFNSRQELETQLGATLSDVAALSKERDQQTARLADVEKVADELESRLKEQESASFQKIAMLEDELKEETLQWMKCQSQLDNLSREAAQTQDTREQTEGQQNESAPRPADVPCKDEHPECHSWASRGECDSNPTYMKRSCRKSCNLCADDTGTKWIDSEAAPTLDDEVAATVNA